MKRKILTFAIIAIAVVLVVIKFEHYMNNPWTRDGYVRANIVEVTPRVTGPIIKVHIQDNQVVNEGDLLFEIDPQTYQADLERAQANLAQMETVLARAINENNRSLGLEKRTPGSVSKLNLNNLSNAVESARANVKAAQAAVKNAELNVSFTQVYAPVSGYITNLRLALGSQVVANQPVFALIDQNSFWIEGYFKETDIKHINKGDAAWVTLMAYPDQSFPGEVLNVGYGIAQSDGSIGNYQLPNVSPNFQWIRLAQRLPVKIKVDNLPQDVTLRVGTTASILIHQASDN